MVYKRRIKFTTIVRKVEVTGIIPTVHATLVEPLVPGEYWSGMQDRYLDEPALIRRGWIVARLGTRS